MLKSTLTLPVFNSNNLAGVCYKFPTMVVDVSISPCNFVSFCFLNSSRISCSTTLEQLYSYISSWIFPLINLNVAIHPSVSRILRGFIHRLPGEYQNLWMHKPHIKIALYLHITYAPTPVYFKSSLDYLQYLIQDKCYVNSCQHAAYSSFTFWNFLECFLDNFN